MKRSSTALCASGVRIDHFQDLIVWQLADELRHEILAFTDTGPASKDFKYRDQIRDAIASACHPESAVEPDPAAHARYEPIYAEYRHLVASSVVRTPEGGRP